MTNREVFTHNEPQIELIIRKHGLLNFIAHPDYILKSGERSVYKELLGYLVRLGEE